MFTNEAPSRQQQQTEDGNVASCAVKCVMDQRQGKNRNKTKKDQKQ
jgi:hypothetical protein